MKTLLIVLSMAGVLCLVGCSGGDQDTEPIKPAATTAAGEPPRPADPNPVTNTGRAPGGDQPIGEVSSSKPTKF